MTATRKVELLDIKGDLRMKKISSVTVFNDTAGLRLSLTYSEIDTTTRKIIKDNVRTNYVLVADDEIKTAQDLMTLAQNILDSSED